MRFARSKADTLTEVLVALSVLGLNILFISHAMYSSHSQLKTVQYRTQAILLCQQILESITDEQNISNSDIRFWNHQAEKQLPHGCIHWSERPPYLEKITWGATQENTLTISDFSHV